MKYMRKIKEPTDFPVRFFFCEKKKSYDYGVCFSDRRNFV